MEGGFADSEGVGFFCLYRLRNEKSGDWMEGITMALCSNEKLVPRDWWPSTTGSPPR